MKQSLYAEVLRGDAEGLVKTCNRLNNCADMLDRRAQNLNDYRHLAEVVEHVLRKGRLGKQSSRRLRRALADVKASS